ncbi:hypothetical protein L345_13812, partial [Ophiophagus hannah]
MQNSLAFYPKYLLFITTPEHNASNEIKSKCKPQKVKYERSSGVVKSNYSKFSSRRCSRSNMALASTGCRVSASHPGSTGNQEASGSPSYSVIQTPLFLNASEGSDVTLNCKVEGNISSRWFVNWMKMGGKEKIKNSNQVFVFKNETDKSSILTLKSVAAADSGIYHCAIGYLKVLKNGSTNVTIWEKPNITVYQMPPYVSKKAGANLSITCNFSRVANVNLMDVTWYKDNQEFPRVQNSEKLKQKVILKLLNVDVKDSGNYVCVIRIGNRTGSGNGTPANLLVIQSPSFIQSTEGENLTMDCKVQGKETKHLHRVSWYKVASDGQKSLMTHGTGVLKDRASLFLRNIKQEDSGNYTCEVDRYGQGNGTRVTILGASESPLEAEPTVAKEAEKHTLTKQTSDVTYADIRFHKREAQPDTEVVYAEVRLGTKRPEHRDRGTQPAGLH